MSDSEFSEWGDAEMMGIEEQMSMAEQQQMEYGTFILLYKFICKFY